MFGVCNVRACVAKEIRPQHCQRCVRGEWYILCPHTQILPDLPRLSSRQHKPAPSWAPYLVWRSCLPSAMAFVTTVTLEPLIMWFCLDSWTWSAYCNLTQVLGVVHFDVSGNNSESWGPFLYLYMFGSLDFLWICPSLYVASYHIEIYKFHFRYTEMLVIALLIPKSRSRNVCKQCIKNDHQVICVGNVSSLGS